MTARVKPHPTIKVLRISVVPYQNGEFEVMLQDEAGKEVVLSGTQKLSEEDFALVNDLAPSCVWTTYTREVR